MRSEYDLIVIGGGLAGAALARPLAENGFRVLVLERETKFKDRVRGEALVPWGVSEAESLGICHLLKDSCAHELVWFDQYAGGARFEHRPLKEATGPRRPIFTFYHPRMQEALLTSAQQSGAEVMRDATVTAVRPGSQPAVSVTVADGNREFTARLVVAADGRNSAARASAKFTVQREQERILIAGLLFDNMPVPDDTAQLIYHYGRGTNAVFFPQGSGRVRSYFVYQANSGPRLQGDADVARFVQAARETGAGDYFTSALPAGPLASFDCADTWVEHPFHGGIALIGDAAYSSSPAWGQGLSLGLRDARVLRDALLASSDWESAAHAYATEHDRYAATVRKVSGWFDALFLDPSAEGEALRTRALPGIAGDPTRVPDHFLSGPDLAADESVRIRFLGESPGLSQAAV